MPLRQAKDVQSLREWRRRLEKSDPVLRTHNSRILPKQIPSVMESSPLFQLI